MKNLFNLIVSILIAICIASCKSKVELAMDDFADAISENDFVKAHKALNVVYQEYMAVWNDVGDIDESDMNNITGLARVYTSNLQKLYCTEIIEIFVSEHNEERAAIKIRRLFSEINTIKNELSNGTETAHYEQGFFSSEYVPKYRETAQYECYRLYSNAINSICTYLYDLSKEHKYYKTAQFAIITLLPSIELKMGGPCRCIINYSLIEKYDSIFSVDSSNEIFGKEHVIDSIPQI